jgi:hypothetical protein
VTVATREALKGWVIQAVKANGGRAGVVEIARHIWDHHEAELRSSGDLFFTWQYDNAEPHLFFARAAN